jgi:hypothetical protein
LFGWFKRKESQPKVPKLDEGDKTFDAANFVLFWISAIRLHKDLDTFRTWLLVYSAAACLAERTAGVEPIPVATSVASATFPGDFKVISGAVVRMAENWKRLCIANPESVQAYRDALVSMFWHPMSGALIFLLEQARGQPQQLELVVRSVPSELLQPTIRALDTLIDEANVAQFSWI